ncbi:sodium/potassium/calcium exchanger 3-like isoform X1 [Bacillus rossius redtenbacheri]|uniref:sodium/potassium/calcium exchanger 3-like isoform X1 n=1 Tax=Bacillus rossius redtenbacheri TaxID=93214 RepID=UPI002FDC7E36
MRSNYAKNAIYCRLLLLVAVPTLYYVAVGPAPRPAPQYTDTYESARGESSAGGRRLLWQANNCTPPAILDFPPDLFTPQQRRSGAAVLHAVLACYLFVLLATVCDDYFVPSIKKICRLLNMSDDVAGATFMAAATSSPELFINSVGTFITEGDIGVGTIVGSAVFNILAVPACCGLFAGQVLVLDWWPLSRDCLMYGVTVCMLILTLYDERVYWYEALLLVSAYTLYISAMYFNEAISGWFRRCCRKPYTEVVVCGEEEALLPDSDKLQKVYTTGNEEKNAMFTEPNGAKDVEDCDDVSSPWTWPQAATLGVKLWWLFTWPIMFVLAISVPDCRRSAWRSCYLLTFFMCILWIGTTSYTVAWMITVIGDTLQIPDSVMGITFLAAGTSVPEAVSSVIVTNQGHGSMGISNSIGSNTFDILLCLGLPWLLKSTFLPVIPGQHYVIINSKGIGYNAGLLMSTLLLLYVSFATNEFKLDRKIGIITLFIYLGFLTLASLIELNVFFPVNLPTCPS